MTFRLLKILPFNIIVMSIIGLTFCSCSISFKKSSRRNVAQIIKTPKIDKASFWGKRLVTLIYAKDKALDETLIGGQCGNELGLKGIKECVRLGADINFKTEEGMTALLGAIERGDPVLVKELLS